MAREIDYLSQMSPIDVPFEEELQELVLEYSPEEVDRDEKGFSKNLALEIPDDILGHIAGEELEKFHDEWDFESGWRRQLQEGINLLGSTFEERSEPFKGACGATHPLLAEAGVQFQSSAYKVLCPSGGPVKTQIIGKKTREIEDQALRVKQYLNYMITKRMKEWEGDTDQLLFWLPFAGSMFRKIYFNRLLKRPMMKMIYPENFILGHYSSDLASSEAYTHIIEKTRGALLKDIASGLYKPITVEEPAEKGEYGEGDELKETVNEAYGIDDHNKTKFEHNILERHVMRSISEFDGWEDEFIEDFDLPYPYIISIDRDTEQILGIRRNWRQGDENYEKKVWFSHYKFLPGLGPKGFSLLHMVGGLSRTATAALRQLIDAGTFSNLPAGFKRRGTRIQGGEELIKPGEFKDVDYFGDRLENAFMALPYSEPSTVLFQLLGFVVQAGQRYTSTTDPMVGDGDQSGPVGTTVALIEQGQKVFSSIHKRLYNAQQMELTTLAEIVSDTMDDEYPYQVVGGDRHIMRTDFDDRVDVIPVADPNISSSAQRIAQAQTAYQIAQGNPQLHDMRAVTERLYTALEMPDIDDILPEVDDPKPMDPVTENMALLNSKPIKAYEDQHHEAHLTVHKQFMQDPRFAKDKAVQEIVGGPMIAHINEHLAFQYKQTMQQGMQMPIQETPDFKDRRDMEEWEPVGIEHENQLAIAAAMAAPGILQQGLQQAAEADPEMKKAQLEAQIKQVDLEEAKIDLEKAKVDLAKAQASTESAQAKAQSDVVTAQAEATQAVEEAKAKLAEIQAKIATEDAKIRASLEEKKMDVDARVEVAEIQQETTLAAEALKGQNAIKLQDRKADDDKELQDEASEDDKELEDKKASTQLKVEDKKAKTQKEVAKLRPAPQPSKGTAK